MLKSEFTASRAPLFDLVNFLWILLVKLKEYGIVRQPRNPWHLRYLCHRELKSWTNQGINENAGSTDLCAFDEFINMEACFYLVGKCVITEVKLKEMSETVSVADPPEQVEMSKPVFP